MSIFVERTDRNITLASTVQSYYCLNFFNILYNHNVRNGNYMFGFNEQRFASKTAITVSACIFDGFYSNLQR